MQLKMFRKRLVEGRAIGQQQQQEGCGEIEWDADMYNCFINAV
jgi:hypothetical protein